MASKATKIIELRAENIKRLKAVYIRADVDFWASTNQRVVPINYGDLYVSERQAVAERDRRRIKMDALAKERREAKGE